jgi:hypothetical protein
MLSTMRLLFSCLIIAIILTIIPPISQPNPFYDAMQMFPELENLKVNDREIKQEIQKTLSAEIYTTTFWHDWKEKNIIEPGGIWKIIPIRIAGKWTKYASRFPLLCKTLKGVDWIALSRLAPNTKLLPHCGWASYSNYQLRCHYPIIFQPYQSYVSVDNEIRWHRNREPLLFDDSRTHFAHNMSKTEDRVVLIMDFKPTKI